MRGESATTSRVVWLLVPLKSARDALGLKARALFGLSGHVAGEGCARHPEAAADAIRGVGGKKGAACRADGCCAVGQFNARDEEPAEPRLHALIVRRGDAKAAAPAEDEIKRQRQLTHTRSAGGP